MHVNSRIIVSALILMAAGYYNAVFVQPHGPKGRPILTRIIVGGYLLAIIASVVDLISPDVGYLAGILMMLAVVTMLYTVLPDLLARIAGRTTQQKGA